MTYSTHSPAFLFLYYFAFASFFVTLKVLSASSWEKNPGLLGDVVLANQRAAFRPCYEMINPSMHAVWESLAFVDLKTIGTGYPGPAPLVA